MRHRGYPKSVVVGYGYKKGSSVLDWTTTATTVANKPVPVNIWNLVLSSEFYRKYSGMYCYFLINKITLKLWNAELDSQFIEKDSTGKISSITPLVNTGNKYEYVCYYRSKDEQCGSGQPVPIENGNYRTWMLRNGSGKKFVFYPKCTKRALLGTYSGGTVSIGGIVKEMAPKDPNVAMDQVWFFPDPSTLTAEPLTGKDELQTNLLFTFSVKIKCTFSGMKRTIADMNVSTFSAGAGGVVNVEGGREKEPRHVRVRFPALQNVHVASVHKSVNVDDTVKLAPNKPGN